jgi:hypothetical protein
MTVVTFRVRRQREREIIQREGVVLGRGGDKRTEHEQEQK